MDLLLEKLGITGRESKAFMTILEKGAQPLSVIAKAVGSPRSSMYVIVGRLKELGLVEEFERSGVKYVQCVPVNDIMDLLKLKEKELEQTMALLEEKMPELESIQNRLSITPQVQFYEGKKAAMKMYEEVLKEKKIWAWFNPQIVKEAMPEYVYNVAKTLRKHKGELQEILAHSDEALDYKERFERKNHEVRILPKGELFEADTIIAGDKIFMISYGDNQVSGTKIVNKALAQSLRVLFGQAWANLG
jgi:sugar-specific transcriptional regulator TrmB